MTLREKCEKVFTTGLTVAMFAKNMRRDPSTIYKWLDGTREISSKVENDIIEEIKRIKNIMDEIDI